MSEQENECCPKFNPELWDEKEFEWKNKKFIKDKVLTLFYIPLNYGQVMKRNFGRMVDGLCLSKQTSMWKMELFLATDKEIAGANNVTLSGKFVSKVYEGEYKEMGKWMNDFQKYTQSKDLTIKNLYMWYTTCPKCAKKYGKNYVVLVAEI